MIDPSPFGQVLGYAVSVIGFAIYSKLKMTVAARPKSSGKRAQDTGSKKMS